MNEDLNIFEEQLKHRFEEVPLPASLEPRKIADFLRDKPEIKVVHTWNRIARIAASFAVVVGIAALSIIALREGNGNIDKSNKHSEDEFYTQSAYDAGVNAESSGEHTADVTQALPESSPDLRGAKTVVNGEFVPGKEIEPALGEALSAAVLEVNTVRRQGEFAAETHEVLGMVDGGNAVTVYAVAMWRDYDLGRDGKPSLVSQTQSPVAVTFSSSVDGYALADYWTPEGVDMRESELQESYPAQL
ncbi:MAG: hypothetical protein RRY38_02125, partial [Oscillospiraceae bacterium]